LGTFGSLSVIFLFYILARLSEKLGSVTKMSPLYRGYYIAQIFVGIAFMAQLLQASFRLSPESAPSWLGSLQFSVIAHQVPLSIGVTISLIITWKYWSWLVTERNG
jgi:hypothetical protein